MRNLIAKILMCIITCAVVGCTASCSSDNEDDFYFGYGSEKSVKEDIAIAMAAGTYMAAYELDTIRIYQEYNGVIKENTVHDYDGGTFPQRGEYMEINGHKIFSPAHLYREQDGLARLAYNLMTGDDGENYIHKYFIEHKFEYNLITSRIGRTSLSLANYDLVYADDRHIVIREVKESLHRYDDYHFVRTTPREIATFKDIEEAWEFFKQKLIELVGEEKFYELLENSSKGPFC